MPTDHLVPPPTTKSADELLDMIAKEVGLDVFEMLGQATFDSISPGICTICLTIHDNVEPDAGENACEECGQSAVKSVLILAGMV